jgi:DNA uptake protein ComE-like DNA-binding protein
MLKLSRLPLSLLALTVAAPVFAAEPATSTTHPSTPAKDTPHTAAAPKAGMVDINNATAVELKNLPGMTEADAARVIQGRPYKDAGELVTKKILPESEFAKIKDRVTTGHSKS